VLDCNSPFLKRYRSVREPLAVEIRLIEKERIEMRREDDLIELENGIVEI
jgi:hypothetical protein